MQVQVSTRKLDRQGVDDGDRDSDWGGDRLAWKWGVIADLYDIINELCWPLGGDRAGIGNHKSDNKIFLKLFRAG